MAPEVVGAPRATPAAVFSRASGPDRGLFGKGRYVSRACTVNIHCLPPRRYMHSSTKEEQRDPPSPPSSVWKRVAGKSLKVGDKNVTGVRLELTTVALLAPRSDQLS